jgi:deoxycytidine triphosphate deaminase
MILSDAEIKKRVKSDKLLEFHDPDRIKYCGCELTLGKAVAPSTGEVLSLKEKSRNWLSNVLSTSKCFVIEPSQTMILVTRETLNMPTDLCATYGQLNRLANVGLIILNTSIVEPGYSGPLSCILVNFSSQKHALAPGDSIAKVNFHTVEGTPDKLFEKTFTPDAYEQLVSKNSISLPKSLLDISGVEDRVTEKVGTVVKKSLVIGSVAIAILLLWSQMEGFLSEWIYKRTGLMDTRVQVEKAVEKQMDDRLKQQQGEYQKQNEDFRRQILDLQDQLGHRTSPKGTLPGGANR